MMPRRKRDLPLMRLLNDREQMWRDRSRDNSPHSGTIPIGGGEWMDSFFRAEGLLGALRALRQYASVQEAILAGTNAAKEAIAIWNRRREYQVGRSDCWVEDFVRGEVVRCQSAARAAG